MIALSSIIGSGWLFGSQEGAMIAGPAAVLSWIIGAVIIGIIALIYVELGTMFPQSGGMSRYAQFSHGSLLGFISSWANWVSLVTLIPIEAVAAVQYMSSWPWAWANWTRGFMKQGVITTEGLMIVFLFMVVFTLMNYYSVNLMAKFTSFISIFKVAIPALTIIMIMVSGFDPNNFGHNLHEFMPFGSAPVLAATTSAGIIFSYNAFQTVLNLAGEIKHPKKNISRAIILSLVISAVIYVLLQVAFIGGVPNHMLVTKGWHGLNFNSPFAEIAILLGLNWLSTLLYLDAFISPLGTGVAFVGTTSRTLASMSQNHHIPAQLGDINPKYKIPRKAMLTNLVISMILVSIFKKWDMLAAVISTSTLIAYLTGPVTAVSLRKMGPDLIRPVKTKALNLMAPLSFVLTSLAIYWGKFPTTFEVILVVIIGLPVYMYYEHKNGWQKFGQQFKSAAWMITYLIVLSIMSYIGSHEFGGINLVPYPVDMLMIVILALIFYYWAIKSAHKNAYFDEAIELNKAANQEEKQ